MVRQELLAGRGGGALAREDGRPSHAEPAHAAVAADVQPQPEHRDAVVLRPGADRRGRGPGLVHAPNKNSLTEGEQKLVVFSEAEAPGIARTIIFLLFQELRL